MYYKLWCYLYKGAVVKKDKSYELILEDILVRTVSKRATAMSWLKTREKEYIDGVGKQPDSDLLQVIEVSRRRIK